MTGVVDVSIGARRWIRRLVFLCLFVELNFLLLDYYVSFSKTSGVRVVLRLCDITREDSLASWFQITQTLFAALTAWFLYLVVRSLGASRRRRLGWILVAAFLTTMTMDDALRLHEGFGTLFEDEETVAEEDAVQDDARMEPKANANREEDIRDAGSAVAAAPARDALSEEQEDAARLDYFPSRPWHLFLGPGFAACGLFAVLFLRREMKSRSTRIRVLVAVGLLACAVGLDFLEGLDESHSSNPYTWITERWDLWDFTVASYDETPYEAVRRFFRSIEESIEMVAITLWWSALLYHLVDLTGSVRFELGVPKRDDVGD